MRGNSVVSERHTGFIAIQPKRKAAPTIATKRTTIGIRVTARLQPGDPAASARATSAIRNTLHRTAHSDHAEASPARKYAVSVARISMTSGTGRGARGLRAGTG